MDDRHRKLLEKQHYNITGKNSAVKICSWTKKSIKDEGVCYKEKFYGIRSHLCCQMSTTVGHCPNKCIICWRPMEYTKTCDMEREDPEKIIDESIRGQKKLLSGLGGNDKVNKDKLASSSEPQHFAISLTGEPFMDPGLGDLIKELHKRGGTTFVVTNGMYPDRIKNLKEFPTQLYVSVDAPNKELFRKIDNPDLEDGWERLMKTLDVLKDIKDRTRTCLRFTIIKGINDSDVPGWADAIKRSDALFVEVKAYMFVGYSRFRLKIENMPRHEEVKRFAEKIADASGYKVIDESKNSRVVLLMKKDIGSRIMKF